MKFRGIPALAAAALMTFAFTTEAHAYCAQVSPTDTFIDISTSSDLGLGNDDSLMCWHPNTVEVFGTAYDNVVISSNGYVMPVSFGVNISCGSPPPAGGTDPNNVAMPNAALPNPIIAPLWDDLDPSAAGAVRSAVHAETGQPQRLIVQWDDVPHASGSGTVKFQVQMEETTQDIIFCYDDVDFGNPALDFGASATVGIEDGTGTTADQLFFNTASLTNNTCIRYYVTCPCVDLDGDGFSATGGTCGPIDCDDADPAVFPGATELCNGVDDDCDGTVDNGFDADGDGFTTCGGDCNDADPAINPAAPEITGNGVDENCNGSLLCGAGPVEGPGAAAGVAVYALALAAFGVVRRRGASI